MRDALKKIDLSLSIPLIRQLTNINLIRTLYDEKFSGEDRHFEAHLEQISVLFLLAGLCSV